MKKSLNLVALLCMVGMQAEFPSSSLNYNHLSHVGLGFTAGIALAYVGQFAVAYQARPSQEEIQQSISQYEAESSLLRERSQRLGERYRRALHNKELTISKPTARDFNNKVFDQIVATNNAAVEAQGDFSEVARELKDVRRQKELIAQRIASLRRKPVRYKFPF